MSAVAMPMPVSQSIRETVDPERTLTSSGRLREEVLSQGDRNSAMWIHLSALVGFVVVGPFAAIVPLVLWLVQRDKSAFVDDHGREWVNACLSYVIYTVLLFWTVIIPVALAIVALVNVVRGAVAASNGEYFRYPLTVRFLS